MLNKTRILGRQSTIFLNLILVPNHNIISSIYNLKTDSKKYVALKVDHITAPEDKIKPKYDLEIIKN